MAGIDLAGHVINDWTYVTSTSTTVNPQGKLGSWSWAGSLHTGGAHFLMGDGAVRFISENVDSTTRKNLSYVSDGQSIGEF
jgi:prepilin-type processing-associated H-X9-DG protein